MNEKYKQKVKVMMHSVAMQEEYIKKDDWDLYWKNKQNKYKC